MYACLRIAPIKKLKNITFEVLKKSFRTRYFSNIHFRVHVSIKILMHFLFFHTVSDIYYYGYNFYNLIFTKYYWVILNI
jgi:hypothetical protein